MLKPFLALLLAAAAAPSAERVVTAETMLDVTIDGTPARLRIDPDAAGLPLVTQAFAQRLGLACNGLLCFGIAHAIGRERIPGRTAVARFAMAGEAPGKRRVGWLGRDYPLAADGVIGPAGLPEPVVRFVLGPAQPGERTVALPMTGGGVFGGWQALRGKLIVAGEEVLVRFDPAHARTLATAGAAVLIARAQDGVLTDERGRQEIAYGVERPFRVMALAQPLTVGPVVLSRIGVRVTDGSGANTLPQEGDDPSEVVVAGKGKKSFALIALGADALRRCSSLVFDKPAKEVRLTC